MGASPSVHIDLVTTAAGSAAPHVAGGRMRNLGIAAGRRIPEQEHAAMKTVLTELELAK